MRQDGFSGYKETSLLPNSLMGAIPDCFVVKDAEMCSSDRFYVASPQFSSPPQLKALAVVTQNMTVKTGPRTKFFRADKQIWAAGGCDAVILSPLWDMLFTGHVTGTLPLKQELVPAYLSHVGCPSFPFLAHI